MFSLDLPPSDAPPAASQSSETHAAQSPITAVMGIDKNDQCASDQTRRAMDHSRQ